MEGHYGKIRCLAFSPPEGKCLASCSEDQFIRVWDLETGTQKYTFERQHGWVLCVAFSYPCGKWLASWGGNKIIKIWNLETGTVQRSISLEDELLQGNENIMETNGETFNTNLSFKTDNNWEYYFIRPKNEGDVEICIWKDWIFIKGKPVIWLPHSHRPRCAAAIGNRLAMGHEHGGVSFMSFRY